MRTTHTIDLPFDLSLNLPTDGEAVVELTLKSETDAREDLEPSDEIVHIFSMAVNSQMFSDAGDRSAVARAAMLESVFDPGVRAWKYLFKIRAFPARSLPVLIALLAQTRHNGDPIVRVTLRPAVETRADVSLDRLIGELANSLVPTPSLPFDVEWADGVLQSRAIMFSFEFSTPISRHVAESCERALNVFDHLLFFGGFKFDFTENEEFFPRVGRTAHLSPTMLTHALDVFEAPPFALNCVFNWAAAIHNQGYSLRRVSLE